jgi:uncharacterized phage protein (predicted DNA packaging)
MYLQLYQIKKHLNIDEDFHDDDEYLMDLAKVAENAVQKHVDTELSNMEDDEGNIPMPLVQAMLLMVGTFYAKRESIAFASAQEVPLAYLYLISLYINYDGNVEGTSNIGGQ